MRGPLRGYIALLVALGAAALAGAHCPNRCSGHGECTGANQLKCSCFGDYTGGDCSQRACPTGKAWSDSATATDTAHAEVECSNRGLCDRSTGQCTCADGYSGKACERSKCPNGCSNRGECVAMTDYAASVDPSTPYVTPWDADKLYGCVCDVGFKGGDCSLRECPRGDDPLTTGQEDEVQVVYCTHTSGSFKLGWSGGWTSSLSVSASAADVKAALEALPRIYPDGISVTLHNGATACSAAGTAMEITFLRNPGDLAPLAVSDSSASGGAVSVHTDGHTESNTGVTSVQGTKENLECAGRGVCDEETGLCKCNTHYASSDGRGEAGTRGDCGYLLAAVVTCPAVDEVECAGHGVCSGDPSYKCTCGDGWTFGDCSKRLCPHGYAWFGAPYKANAARREWVECSGQGTCDRSSGQCKCFNGFAGASCERTTCPQTPSGARVCSNHGKCLSMRELGKDATSSGALQSVTYGSPGVPASWDADRIFGCLCDTDYTGFDCSQRLCPVGDDPLTPGSAEVQVLVCDATSGTFTLAFRSEHGLRLTSAPVDATGTGSDLAAALSALSSVTGVDVSVTDLDTGSAASALCAAGGNVAIKVTFTDEFGDLPDLEPGTDLSGGAATVTVYSGGAEVAGTATKAVSVQGSKESQECSNRGTCNRGTGECECFTGYMSSDGHGGPGARGDCGYKSTILRGSRPAQSRTSGDAGAGGGGGGDVTGATADLIIGDGNSLLDAIFASV